MILYYSSNKDQRPGMERLVGRVQGWPYWKFAMGKDVKGLLRDLRVNYHSCRDVEIEPVPCDSWWDENGTFSPPYEIDQEFVSSSRKHRESRA